MQMYKNKNEKGKSDRQTARENALRDGLVFFLKARKRVTCLFWGEETILNLVVKRDRQ